MEIQSVIEELNEDILKYDNIILLEDGIDIVLLSDVKRHILKKQLFMIPERLYSADKISFPFFKMLSAETEKIILDLYGLYEFADSFSVFSSNNKVYGSIMNLVKTDILTEEEAYFALLK